MTDGRLSNEELEGFHEKARQYFGADRAELLRLIAHIATLQREADEMREALTWVGEVYPATSPESGGAIVHMTWEQFNAMRAQVGLKPVKGLSIRAALKALPPQQDANEGSK